MKRSNLCKGNALPKWHAGEGSWSLRRDHETAEGELLFITEVAGDFSPLHMSWW